MFLRVLSTRRTRARFGVRQRRPSSLSFRIALISRGGFRFQEIVDLVFEPGDRIRAEIDVLRKSSSRLEPTDMHAGPRDAAFFQVGKRQQPSAGTLASNLWTSRHVGPHTLMLCEVLPQWR